ncbi:RasGEF domain-containing protein [Legionella cincinnatiensis]|uniref:Coiled-coil protein n=1 Tax=Legionella cincinnatiensis TaxID=28085 RepID=A0A378INP2_9GAMM|nr:RasGEF domain-containing protein [Legionella cincinnatiensis]KTC92024.1 coiled-coil protein [Legionella cincinnatiensis]STX33674.1 coiled-coil protein [Legionella cincinnatiensis]
MQARFTIPKDSVIQLQELMLHCLRQNKMHDSLCELQDSQNLAFGYSPSNNDLLNQPKLSFSILLTKWDELLLNKKLNEQIHDEPKMASHVRTVNHKAISLLAGTMTRMVNAAYSEFAKTVNARLNQGESIQAITKELVQLSSYQSEYIRNELLKRLDTASCRLLFERFVLLAKQLTEMGNYFSAQAVYQAFVYSDIQKIFDKKDWSGLSPQIKIILHYLESLYGPGEASRNNLAWLLEQPNPFKLPVINRITTKFELTIAGRDENLKLKKIRLEEQLHNVQGIKTITEKNEAETSNADIQTQISSLQNEQQDSVYGKIEDGITQGLYAGIAKEIDEINLQRTQLNLSRVQFINEELRCHLSLFNNQHLEFSKTLKHEIVNENVKFYLFNQKLLGDLNQILKNCENKLQFILTDKKGNVEEQCKKLLWDSYQQLKLIVEEGALSAPQYVEVVRRFCKEFKRALAQQENAYSYQDGCQSLLEELSSLTNQISNGQKQYERNLMRRSKNQRSHTDFFNRMVLVDHVQNQLYLLPDKYLESLLELQANCLHELKQLDDKKRDAQKSTTFFGQKLLNDIERQSKIFKNLLACLDQVIHILVKAMEHDDINRYCHAEVNRLMVQFCICEQSLRLPKKELFQLFSLLQGVRAYLDQQTPNEEYRYAKMHVGLVFDEMLSHAHDLQSKDSKRLKFSQMRAVLLTLTSPACETVHTKIEYLENLLSAPVSVPDRIEKTVNNTLYQLFNKYSLQTKTKKSKFLSLLLKYYDALKNLQEFELDQHQSPEISSSTTVVFREK